MKIFDAGGDLLSHTLPGAVPSAQTGLASGFGKGPGVTPSQKPPTNISGNTHPHHPTRGVIGVPCHPRHCTADATINQSIFATHAHPTGCNSRYMRYFFARSPNSTPTHKQGIMVESSRSISTGHLHTSLRFQIRPINPIIYREPQKKPHLETGFPLRCFQRLSLPYVANQPCHGRDNWPTRGMSNPVLSY